MKHFLFLFLSIGTTVFAQEQPTAIPNNDFKKIQIGINVSPDYCFRTLKNNNGSSSADAVIEMRNKYEAAKPGFTAGLNFVFNLKQKFGIEMGIQFSNKGYKETIDNLTFGSAIDPRRGFVYSTTGKPLTEIIFTYNDYYIDVPVKANFVFGKKKLRAIASLGIVANFFIEETIITTKKYADGTKDNNSQKSTDDYNKFNLSPMVSFGVDWKLSSKSSLRIEPVFRYGVLKIIDTPVTAYLWNTGLNIAYYFGVK